MLTQINTATQIPVVIDSRPQTQTSKKMRLLIVDDDEELGRLLCTSLKKRCHCTVSRASDSFEAMNMLTEQFYDLIILDWKLPALNGAETLSLLEEGLIREPDLPREWDYKKVPVILFTSSEKKECLKKLRRTTHFNVVGFVSKCQELIPILNELRDYVHFISSPDA